MIAGAQEACQIQGKSGLPAALDLVGGHGPAAQPCRAGLRGSADQSTGAQHILEGPVAEQLHGCGEVAVDLAG
jgi:hypothetical protein